MRPPASTTATVWAAARSRDHRFISERSGWRIGWIVPRSGQVPTTTSDPSARMRRTVCSSWRTEALRSIRWVTSLAPTMMSTTSGRMTSSSAFASWRSRSLDSAPTTARLVSRTRRPVRAATPLATIAPTVSWAASTPMPAAELSPSTTTS